MVGAAILKVSEECQVETALPAPSSPHISGYPSTAALCTSQINPCLALKTNQGVRETARPRGPAAPAPVHFSRPHTPAAQSPSKRRREAGPGRGRALHGGAPGSLWGRRRRRRGGRGPFPALTWGRGRSRRQAAIRRSALPHPSSPRGGAPAHPAPLYGAGPARERRLREQREEGQSVPRPPRPAGCGHGCPRARAAAGACAGVPHLHGVLWFLRSTQTSLSFGIAPLTAVFSGTPQWKTWLVW